MNWIAEILSYLPLLSLFLLIFTFMEAFQLLSRGGVQFNKNRFKKDVDLFNVMSAPFSEMH